MLAYPWLPPVRPERARTVSAQLRALVHAPPFMVVPAAIGIASALGLLVSGVRLGPGAIGIVLAVSAAAAVPRRHAVTAALLLCPALLAFGLADDFASENGALFLGLAVLCCSLGTRPDHLTAGLATGCLFACCQALKVTIGDPLSPPFLFVTFGSFMLGGIVESRRLLVREMAARQREASDELETYSALVVSRERARIARDLHDIVAHCIAVMVIQAGAGRLTSQASREQATAAFSRIREAGSEALAEMQKLVDMLGPEQAGADGRARLKALMHQVQAAGLSVDLIGADTDVDEMAFRIVQEGLTNVLKHAPGSPVTVSFRQLETKILIEITNARASPGHPQIGFKTSRRGLSGMRERVEATGGELQAGALPDGGWQLRVRLPRHCARGDAGLGSGLNVPLQSPTTS